MADNDNRYDITYQDLNNPHYNGNSRIERAGGASLTFGPSSDLKNNPGGTFTTFYNPTGSHTTGVSDRFGNNRPQDAHTTIPTHKSKHHKK